MNIKVICFDLDGVYFSPIGKEKFNIFLRDTLGLSLERISAFHNSAEMGKLVRGQITEQGFYDFFRGYMQSNITDDEIKNAWVAGYEIDPSVRQVLLNLKLQGYKICACTNNNEIRLGALREKFPEFRTDFDFIVSSHEVGECKPEEKIFQKLIDRSDVAPDGILYSDDKSEKLTGAKKLGIQTFVYKNFDQFCDELEKYGITTSNENRENTIKMK